ncbi:rds1 [Diplocarpon rosae]|nr:rds1 [Diplocarpon rosae]
MASSTHPPPQLCRGSQISDGQIQGPLATTAPAPAGSYSYPQEPSVNSAAVAAVASYAGIPAAEIPGASNAVPPIVSSQVTGVTSHGPYSGTPTTTGALSNSPAGTAIPVLPPNPTATTYSPDGTLHDQQPIPYTPAGGLGTNGTEPVYRVQSDFDYQSILLGVDRAGPMIFRQFAGLFPMPVWFETGIPQSWAWTLLAPYISECPANSKRLAWQNFPALTVLNQPNSARWNASQTGFNETTGFGPAAPSRDPPAAESCLGTNVTGFDCSPAIAQNRSIPLSYPGREVYLSWEDKGRPVGPNNSYVTDTSAGAPAWVLWVSQLNITYSPLTNISSQDGAG